MLEHKRPKLSTLHYYIALSMLTAPLWLKARLLSLTNLDPSTLWDEWGLGLAPYIKYRDRFLNFNSWEEVQSTIDTATKNNISIITQGSALYPKALKDLCDAPVILFCKGDLSILNTTSISVVGTRAASAYGTAVTSSFIPRLVEAGFCIVSGMARGIDALAHRSAMISKGKTIAVLGSGVDVPSPVENRSLYNDILSKEGLVVSEFFPGTHALKQNFPQRNRIVAGLSCGVLVVEAGVKSGSLITADIANSYSRDVFAVPGPVTSSLSVGVNGLIKNGAVVASEPDDILAHYNLLIKQNKFRPDLSLEQKELLLFIPPQGASLNQILSESGKALTQVLKTIDELMEAGYINKAGLGIYYLN